VFKPLGRTGYKPLGDVESSANETAEQVEALPGSVFFAACETGGRSHGSARHLLQGPERNHPPPDRAGSRWLPLPPVAGPEKFTRLGTIIFIPEVDPRPGLRTRTSSARTFPSSTPCPSSASSRLCRSARARGRIASGSTTWAATGRFEGCSGTSAGASSSPTSCRAIGSSSSASWCPSTRRRADVRSSDGRLARGDRRGP